MKDNMGRYDEKKTFDSMVGKTIKAVHMGEDNIYLVFETTDGEFHGYEAEGDCCSSSWFSHVTGLKNLVGEEIVSVEGRDEYTDEEYKEAEKEGDYESLALYGFMLKTKKGTCDIEMRNDSNGYYGGTVYPIAVSKAIQKTLKPVEEDI